MGSDHLGRIAVQVDRRRRLEEETGLCDEVGKEVAAFLDEVEDLFELFLIRFGESGLRGGLGRRFLVEISSDQRAIGAGGQPFDPFVVEPFRFLVVEFCPALVDPIHREGFDQLLHRKKFLTRTVIPAKHGQQVDKGLREEAGFPEAGGGLTGLWIGPVHGEYGEAEAVAVAFAELAMTVGFQD